MSRLLAAVATVLMLGATTHAQAIPNSVGVRIFLVVRPQQASLDGASQRGIDGFAHRMLRRKGKNDKEDKNDMTAVQAAFSQHVCLTHSRTHCSVCVRRAAQDESRFGLHVARREIK